VTRLDEAYIKKIGKNVKNYKYWIANSYSLPTEDILNFFRGTYNKAHGKGDMRIRPVFSHLILIPAIIVYCLSVVFGRFGSFKKVVSIAIIFLSFMNSNVHAQEEQKHETKELPAALRRDLDKMKSGKASRKEVLKIAENLMKNNEDQRASELYSEYSKEGDEEEVLFNRATSLLKTGKLDEAMPLIQKVFKTAKNEEIKDKLRHNVVLAMNQSGGKSKNNKDDKKDKKEDEKEDKKEGKEGKDGDKQDDKKDKKENQGKDGKDSKENKDGKGNKDQNQNQKSGDKNDKKDDKDNKDNKDPKDLEKPEREESKPKSLEEKEKMIEQKRRMVKTPAMVKQILSDDRELQKKMMDTSTNERGSQKPKRDW
jgi:Ca-activated chloride channel family protein